MRINFIAFLVGITFLNVCATVKAQQISITAKQAPLTEVLDGIKKQSGYQFLYDKKQIATAKPVTINVKGAELKQVLDVCFEQQQHLTYEIVGKTVVVKAKEKSLRERVTNFFKSIKIAGTVTDESNKSLVGATIKVKGTDIITQTNSDGMFVINNAPGDAVLQISFLGYQSKEVTVKENNTSLVIRLEPSIANLDELAVVSTGYQKIAKERATGSFVQIDNQLLNRKVSTNILDRIEDITPGLYTNGLAFLSGIATRPSDRSTGMTIRGASTFKSSTEPLIVVDNFPYEGQLSNLNPNDIETITVLKDAAAASIWGARSANGVIVITTKKGNFNQKMSIEVNSNVTLIDRPNLYYSPNFLPSSSYLELEQSLFSRGFYNDILNDNIYNPAITPAVALLARGRAGTISASEVAVGLENLKSHDVRDDYTKYIYQQAVNQQYSLGVRGGAEHIAYQLSVGFDKNKAPLRRNSFDRTTINSNTTFIPLPNLELNMGINYSQNKTVLSNAFGFGSYSGNGNPNGNIYPYARLADDNGSALNLPLIYNDSYLNLVKSRGMLDWSYNPLNEMGFGDNQIKLKDLLLRAGAKYSFDAGFNLQLQYQNEHQQIQGRNLRSQETFYARNLINRFAVYNSSSGTTTFNFPLGGILALDNSDWNSNSFRAQLNYDRQFGKHAVTALGGAELRELNTEGSYNLAYGYIDVNGTSISNLNFTQAYPTNPAGSSNLPSTGLTLTGTLNRYVSYYANAAYSYDGRYTATLSARADGANLYGAKTNDKIAPLWSAGLGWLASREQFYSLDWLPYLRLRATYGFNGNTNQRTTAYLTATYSEDDTNGARVMVKPTAPNPSLRWERVKNINVGLDFGTKGNRLKGTIELYQKNGKDLIQATAIAPQTGFTTYDANTANSLTRGMDVTLQSENHIGRVNWRGTLLFSAIKGKVVRYDVIRTRNSITSLGGAVGKPLEALFAYSWAGLDAATGDPQGYLGGNVSKNYTAIINIFSPDSLRYMGSAMPTVYGNFRNDFSCGAFSLSVNISYRLGYMIRRSSTSLNYADVLLYSQHRDYERRWKAPGDELQTQVPSLSYVSNYDRNFFYQYSAELIEPGDHIRLQDIRLSYDVPTSLAKRIKANRLSIYSYASNLGIIWRKNKLGLDPSDAGSGLVAYPAPFSISFGLNVNF